MLAKVSFFYGIGDIEWFQGLIKKKVLKKVQWRFS